MGTVKSDTHPQRVHPKEGGVTTAQMVQPEMGHICKNWRLQKSLRLSPPWAHLQESTVTAWGLYTGAEPTLAGRCGLTLRSGAATFDIDPTPDQMRAIAALLIEAADTAWAA